MPTEMPAIVASASGVSWTRSLPKRSCNPAVARNTPPLTPTSCPITTTLGSCCISQACAVAIASTMVTLANSVAAGLGAVTARGFALLLQMLRNGGEQEIEHGIRRLLRGAEVLADGRFDLGSAIPQQSLFLVRIPDSRFGEKRAHTQQRLQAPGVFDFRFGPVAAGVVGGRVIAQPVSQRFDDARTSAGPRGFQRGADHMSDGDHVVAVDLNAANSRRHGFLGECLRSRLFGRRYRDGPAVVDDHEDD